MGKCVSYVTHRVAPAAVAALARQSWLCPHHLSLLLATGSRLQQWFPQIRIAIIISGTK